MKYFNRDWKCIDRERIFFKWNLYIFDAEARISVKKQDKHGGKDFNFKLNGETTFLGGSSSYLGWAMFQQGPFWGLLLSNDAFTGRNAIFNGLHLLHLLQNHLVKRQN